MKTHQQIIDSLHTIKSSKHQSPNLNTLPRRPPLPCPRILERRMRCPRSSPMTIITLQKQPLMILHPTPIPPFLLPIILYSSGLTHTIRIPMLNPNHLLLLYTSTIRYSQRKRNNWSIQRPPDIYYTHAGGEESGSFVREMEMYALACCLFGLIDVGAMHWLACCVFLCFSDCVIEEEDSLSSFHMT